MKIAQLGWRCPISQSRGRGWERVRGSGVHESIHDVWSRLGVVSFGPVWDCFSVLVQFEIVFLFIAYYLEAQKFASGFVTPVLCANIDTYGKILSLILYI